MLSLQEVTAVMVI